MNRLGRDSGAADSGAPEPGVPGWGVPEPGVPGSGVPEPGRWLRLRAWRNSC